MNTQWRTFGKWPMRALDRLLGWAAWLIRALDPLGGWIAWLILALMRLLGRLFRWLFDRLFGRLFGRAGRPRRPHPRTRARRAAGPPASGGPRRRDAPGAGGGDASRMDPYLNGLRTLHESGLDPDLAIDAAEAMGRNYRRRYEEPDTGPE